MVSKSTPPKLLCELVKQDDAGDQELLQIVEVLLRRAAGRGTSHRGPQGSFVGKGFICILHLPFAYCDQPVEHVESLAESIVEPLLSRRGKKSAKRFKGKLYLVDPTRRGSEADHKNNAFAALAGELKRLLPKAKPIEWNGDKLAELVCDIPSLGIRYYPKLIRDGVERARAIGNTRKKHDAPFRSRHGKIQFVGMSVYKEEATTSVELDKIYIPLRVVSEDAIDEESATKTNPVELLSPGGRHVILGDPGSGKSTMLRFLALAGTHSKLKKRFNLGTDQRLPVLVILRRLADELKADPKLDLLDYIVQTEASDLAVDGIDREFLEYYLYAGRVILLFDGIDELPGGNFKAEVRDRIATFLQDYPGNTYIVTTRIVGYDKKFRYDKAGFTHHRVAKLTGPDIEEFIANWYGTRIPLAAERRQHVEDLAGIMRNAESRAIRDLAENPLLLTIVCLVHRIDAVLPDERVVLYQKCTETLLNTWHNWKFRTVDQGNRGEVEARNRARIEAIAFWMQCTFDELADAKRAVASEVDLKEFLTDYIVEVEELEENAEELAEEFFRFIRERAGLLIEVGDKEYSFVHLTFQEYLTATYLKKSGEVPGVAFIWGRIQNENRLANSRWHEVIRLLVASMDHPDARKYFLEKIVPGDSEADFYPRTLLAAGCLLDGIDAARKDSDRIVACLLRGAVFAEDLVQLRAPLAHLRSWQEGGTEMRQQIAAQTILICELDPECRLVSVLVLAALGWEYQVVRETLPGIFLETNMPAARIELLYDEDDIARVESDYNEMLIAWLCNDVVRAPSGSVTTQVFSALAGGLRLVPSHCWNGWSVDAVPKLEMLLCLCRYSLMIFASYQLPSATLLGVYGSDNNQHARTPVDWNRIKTLMARVGVWDMERVSERSERFRHIDRSLDQALNRDRRENWIKDWKLIRGRLDRSQNWDRHLTRLDLTAVVSAFERAIFSDSPMNGRVLWKSILAESNVEQQMVENFINLLQLKPATQWHEALRVHVVPKVPERITIVNPQIWQSTLASFESKQASDIDCRHAATHLLFDMWLYLIEYHDTKVDSPFARLAELTEDADDPALQLVHCLRDLAYGEKEREQDLKEMVESEDPAMRKLLVDSLWRDPKE